MEFGMSRRIKPNEKYVCISMKENLAQFGRRVAFDSIYQQAVYLTSPKRLDTF